MMQYRRFGQNYKYRCFPAVYALSVQVARCPTVANSPGQTESEATIRRAIEVGINHIETARGYGTSEMQLGQILPTFPRDQLIVQTKVNPAKIPESFTISLSSHSLT